MRAAFDWNQLERFPECIKSDHRSRTGALALMGTPTRVLPIHLRAQDVLYHHGGRHREAFEKALKDQDQDQSELDRLSTGLQKRLESALRRSVQKDAGGGRAYNPPRIDEQAMRLALKDDPPWVP
jgi:hypothetical protein